MQLLMLPHTCHKVHLTKSNVSIAVTELPSSDIFGFSSFFFKTDSMRTLSCLKITAIFTGAYKDQRRQTLALLSHFMLKYRLKVYLTYK